MPRNRTARLAVLASVAQRSEPAPYPSRSSSALRRRAVAAALVLVSLTLITVYFREADAGPLHGVQGAGAAVLRPFEVAAERISRPFRDVYGYFGDLADAKAKADRLERENRILRERMIVNADAVAQLALLRRQLHYKAPPAVSRLPRVSTQVIAQPRDEFDQSITIAAGANDGIKSGNAVLDPGGNLVGRVVLANSNTARVALLTDESVAVGAKDVNTAAQGVVKRGDAQGNLLILDRVSKQERVHDGDVVITSGFKIGDLKSLYPRGIPIGWVSSVEQLDTDEFKRVQVTPNADLSNLESVMVVVTPKQARGLP